MDHEFEAKFRDEEIANEAEVNAWLAEMEVAKVTATRAKNSVLSFLKWQKERGAQD